MLDGPAAVLLVLYTTSLFLLNVSTIPFYYRIIFVMRLLLCALYIWLLESSVFGVKDKVCVPSVETPLLYLIDSQSYTEV